MAICCACGRGEVGWGTSSCNADGGTRPPKLLACSSHPARAGQLRRNHVLLHTPPAPPLTRPSLAAPGARLAPAGRRSCHGRPARPVAPRAVSGEFEPQLDPNFAAQQLTVLGVTVAAGAYWWCAE